MAPLSPTSSADRMGGAAHLLLRAADLAIAVPASCALEIWQTERCHPVPSTPPHVIGIASWRGTPLPLVDLSVALGLRGGLTRAILDGRRAAVISSGPYLVGLVVEGTLGVVDIGPGQARRPSVVRVGRLAELATGEIDAPGGSVAAVLDLPAFLEAARVRS
jgi:chemotaxis signal transduction protein